MSKKVFIAGGIVAIAGGVATILVTPSCDAECTLEARASALVTVRIADGSALGPAQVQKMWYRVSDVETPRAAPVDPDGDDLTAPGSDWKLAACADSGCSRWVLGYETPGYYEIRASVCGRTHQARTVVGMTADGCHVETEELEILVDAEDCADDPERPIAAPPPTECTLEARPSLMIQLVDADHGTAVKAHADSLAAMLEGQTAPIQGTCLDEECSMWSVGTEQAGTFHVVANVCGTASELDVRVPMTADGCHVETQYRLMEVDASRCSKPFTAVLPETGPTCDKMARPSAIVFPVKDLGDVWAPVKVESLWYEHDGTRHDASCLDGDCSLGAWVVGWEQPGRFRVQTRVCDAPFETSFSVPMGADGCHVDTQYVPLMVDEVGCPRPH
jgi:hypothetical protein